MAETTPRRYWLFKTEPQTYSFDDLLKDRKTNWDGVRNFLARNYLRQCKRGDEALIYHSGKEKGLIGLARVIREAYPDPDPRKKGDWVQIDIAPVHRLKHTVTLAEIKGEPRLRDLPLVRQPRLSVMPLTPSQFKFLVALSEKK